MARKIKDYRLLESVGEDPLGTCYLASSADGKQMVWLTVGQKSFERGDQASALEQMKPVISLRDEHVLSLLDLGFEDDGKVYQVHDFYNGASLHRLLEKNGPLRWDVACALAARICRALVKAHGRGVHHGRLVPELIVLGEDGSVKLRGLGYQSMLDRASGEIMLSGGEAENDVRQIADLVRVMVSGLKASPDHVLPAEIQGILAWDEQPPAVSQVLNELDRFVSGTGDSILQEFLTDLSFFFLLNRTFGDDVSSQDEGDEVVFTMEPAVEPEEHPGTDKGWADDLGGVFEEDQKLVVEDVPEIEPKRESKFSALETLERREREEVERRRVWVRNGLLGTAILLIGLLLFAGIQIFTGPAPEEIARLEMLEEFPRFEADYNDLEVVRVPAQENEDETIGGTVVVRWQDEVAELLRGGDLARARVKMNQAAEQDRGDWKRHAALANLYLPDSATTSVELLKAFQLRVPKPGPLDLVLARILSDQLNQHEAAMDILEDAPREFRNDPAYLELLLRVQEGLKDMGGMVITLRDRLQLTGGNTPVNQIRLAESYLNSGDFLRAREGFSGLLRGPDGKVNRQGFWGFVEASRGLGEVKAMVEVSQGLHRKDPDSRDVMLFLAEYYLGRRKYQEVESYLDLLDASDVSWRTLFLRGISAFRQGDLKHARSLLMALQGLRPKDARVMYNLAMVLREMEKDRASFSALAAASELSPDFWLPLCAMGQDYHGTGDFKSAGRMFERAAKLKEHPWLQEIVTVDMASKKAEDLAAKPCLHTGMIESTLYDLVVAPAQPVPVPFRLKDMDRFHPDFRKIER